MPTRQTLRNDFKTMIKPSAARGQGSIRPPTRTERNIDFLNNVELPLVGGLGDFLRSELQDELIGGPAGKVVGKAALIIPKRLWQERIDRVVEGMKRDIPKLGNIPAGEKFVSEMERWMRELHPEIASHVNKFRIFNQAEADKIIGKGYGGHYKSAEKYARWPSRPGIPTRVENIKRYRGEAADARTDPSHVWHSLTAEDYDDMMDNAIEIRERPDRWANPLDRFSVAAHEYGHAAQEIGFPEKYDEGLKRYQSFLSDKVPKPHLYPPEVMEIGARVTARKSPFDAARLGMAGEAPPGTSFERPAARDLWKEEILSGANQSNAYLKKGSGRNIQQGIANRTIPDINRALKFRRPLEPTILPPSSQRRIINPTDPDWYKKNYDWGRHGKYSIFIDDTGPAMSVDELIARGYLK